MTWHDTKQAAVDPDNPAANEQIPYTEWNNMVTYLKDKINNKTVDLTGLLDDMIMVYDLPNDKFVFEAKSTVGTLNDLTDVVISGVPADNEVLAYNTVTSKFINQTAAEAGLALVADVVLESDFDATTFLYATANDTPQPKTVTETLAILSVESGADATDATNVNAAGAVMESDFDATTFLYALADNTPLPKTIAETLAILNVESGSDATDATNVNAAGAVMESDFSATTFMYALANNTPLPKTPAETMAILSGAAGAEFLFNTQKIGGIVDPTTAQQAATKNYDDTHLFTKEAVTDFTDNYIPVYRTSSGKFEMEEQSAAAGLPVIDTTAIVKGSGDGTKRMRFEVDYNTTGITRVMTVPDKDITLCGIDEVMMNPASENLDMADYNINGLDIIKAFDWVGIKCFNNSGNELIRLCADGAAFLANATVDMGGHSIKDQKNSAASALSGTQKDIEIDIGGVPYYFTVYPTKA